MSDRTNQILHLAALLCVAAVGTALVSQHIFDLQPCAWCVLQRLIYLSIALICWLGTGLSRRPALRSLCAGLATLLGAGGAAAAWYQYDVAAHLFSCDQTFADRFMVSTGLDAGLPWLFGIFASCMDAKVHVLGLDYALWSLALFCVIVLLGLAALFQRRH